MSPGAHLIASWLIASTTTKNPRDRKLVTLAGILPDADGLGIVVDGVSSLVSGKECTFHYYQHYHHLLLHGWPGAIVIALILTGFGRERWRVFLWCLVTFHLHLLCDLLGSRGPDIGDLWSICYSEPIFRHPIWFWKSQWRLDGWQNLVIFSGLFATSVWLAVKRGYWFVELVSERADKILIQIFRKWFGRQL